MLLALFLTAIALCGATLGIRLGVTKGLPPQIAAAGGGLLFGISLLWILPEMAEHSGWLTGVLSLAAGIGVLWCIDHFLYPICPSCSHSHDHHHCDEPPLHGFGAPLLIATGIHSLLDGWSIRLLAPNDVTGFGAPLGLALHKIPEGLAIGLLARESLNSSTSAFLWCALAESFTLLGAFLEPLGDQAATLRFGAWWITCVLALTGGSFLFLGFHSVHGNRKRPGVVSTFLLTLLGVAGLAVVHWHYRLL